MSVLTCAFCLSSERNLFFIDERRFQFIYSLFEVDDGQYLKYLHTEGRLRACWVCQARLCSCASFATTAQRSVRLLRSYLSSAHEPPPHPLHSLCVTEVELVDITPQAEPPGSDDAPRVSAEPVFFEVGDEFKNAIKVEDLPHEYYSDADVDQVQETETSETLKKEYTELKVKLVKKEIATKKSSAKKRGRSGSSVPLSTSKKKKTATKKKKSVDFKTVTSKPVRKRSTHWTIRWATNERARQLHAGERASETGDFPCERCGRRTFADEAERAQHVAAKHSESAGAFECDICGYRFGTKPELERHIVAHCRFYRCPRCPWETRDLGHMRGHAGTHTKARAALGTKEEKERPCQRCKESFPSSASLRAHKSRCSTYKCAQCGRAFRDRSAYFKHTPVHKEANSKDKLYCQVCDRQFTSPQWFKTHFRTSLKHVSRDSFQHECPHCQLRFHIAQRLKEHIAVKHLNRGLYACDMCPKSYTVNVSLRKHRARVHNIGSVRAPARDKVCDHCGKAFTSNHLLNNHVRLHTGEKPFKCPLCPAAFAQNGTLYMHTLSVHRKKLSKDGAGDSTEDAPYQCEECGKGFWSSSQQRAHHKLFHLKQSNFTCEVCNKMFASSSHLKDHLAGRHGVLYSDSFKCDTCGKRFNTPSALRVHIKTHSAETSLHKCRACDAAFRNPGQLYVHFKLKHLKLKRGDKVSVRNISNPERELIVNGKPQ